MYGIALIVRKNPDPEHHNKKITFMFKCFCFKFEGRWQ